MEFTDVGGLYNAEATRSRDVRSFYLFFSQIKNLRPFPLAGVPAGFGQPSADQSLTHFDRYTPEFQPRS